MHMQTNLLYNVFSLFTKHLKTGKIWDKKKRFETGRISIGVLKMRKLRARDIK